MYSGPLSTTSTGASISARHFGLPAYVSNYFPVTGNVLPISFWPEPILNAQCERVTEFDKSIRQLTMDMAKTMQRSNGLGLAAPQVGKNIQVIVAETNECPILLINPEITEIDNTTSYSIDEGCLSIPGYYEKRQRAQRVRVRYQNVNGNIHEHDFQGLMAFVIQHEIDHLNGKLFIDDLSPLKKSRIKSKIKKTLRAG